VVRLPVLALVGVVLVVVSLVGVVTIVLALRHDEVLRASLAHAQVDSGTAVGSHDAVTEVRAG